MKIEITTTSGKTPKEIIIEFFQTNPEITKEDATEFYASCEEIGHLGGTHLFDEAISAVTKALDLDEAELTSLISQ